MGVYIKGLNMPQNCDACPMLYEYRFCALTDDHASSIGWEMEKKRMPNCPLIELPDHGRLIDADALINKWRESLGITEEDRGAVFVGYTQIPSLVNLMPTVIGEDRSEEGKNERTEFG